MTQNTNLDYKTLCLQELAQRYPNRLACAEELVNLKAILELPALTEHFVSDLHGEADAFRHLLNNCSGVILNRAQELLGDARSAPYIKELVCLIYYPAEKLPLMTEVIQEKQGYQQLLYDLVLIARSFSASYTRSYVRRSIEGRFAYILEELLHASATGELVRHDYHKNILLSIEETKAEGPFIEAISSLIKRLAVGRLHILGDIFDRGPAPDEILDLLIAQKSVDIQWGNHDIAWMGASFGSLACIASCVRVALRNQTLEVLEQAYGISLRKLALFARNEYGFDSPFVNDRLLMERAMSVILAKLEGQLVKRNPAFEMDERLILETIDEESRTVHIKGKTYQLKHSYFPTIDDADPYQLSPEEAALMVELKAAFMSSGRLARHVDFLLEKGSLYKIVDNNLLLHGCIPLNADGSFYQLNLHNKSYAAKDYLDFCDAMVRRAARLRDAESLDWMWYLSSGIHSPLSGRATKSFERSFIADSAAHVERQDPYFTLCSNTQVVKHILASFGIDPNCGHLINGHTPVKVIEGESPVRANGRYLCIDGGFCKAYNKKTGIAGYTLISTAKELKIVAHSAFCGHLESLQQNEDILGTGEILERYAKPHQVKDVDASKDIFQKIALLEELTEAFAQKLLPEHI